MPAATYRGNRKRMAALALLAWVAFSVVLDARGTYRLWQLVIGGAVIAAAVAAFAWMLSLRLTLSPEGLSYRSLLGSRELRWGDVERIHWYNRGWITIHFIPIAPPDLHVDIFMKDGSRLRLGDSLANAKEVVPRVIELTLPHLYRRMLGEVNRGGLLELDAVRMSRASGIELRGLFGTHSLGLDEIERYGDDDEGNFRVWRRGGGSHAVPIHRVANVNALMDVIAAITGLSPTSA